MMRSVRAELLSSTGWFGSVHASEFEAELTRRSALRLSESREKASPRVETLGRRLAAAAMPSVGMRRTTRVFGVVKGADGARVLRSGRRLWQDSADFKVRRHSDGEDWLKMVKSGSGGGGGGGGKVGGGFEAKSWPHSANKQPKRSLPAAPVVEIELPKPQDSEATEPKDGRRSDKMFQNKYVRKRKGLGASSGGSGNLFSRRQRRRLNSGEGFAVANEFGSESGFESGKVINVVAESSLARNCFVAHFLWIVLVYMTRAKLRLSDLSAFLASEPISCVISLSGISIRLDDPLIRRLASCKIFGAVQFVPLFSVDFSAVPLCFMNMYSDMFSQHRRQLRLQHNSTETSDESDDEVPESGAETRSDAINADNGWVSNPFLKGSKLVGRSTHYRSGLVSGGIQKRRSSLGRRRARNPSLGGVQKANGLVSDLVSFRKNAVLSVTSKNKVRRSLRSSSGRNLKEVSSRTDGLAQDKNSTSCFANMLVIGPDKCYREEGANVMLDMSPLGEWVIAVKKDGSMKFTHKAEKVMKPYSSNRFTHAVIWTGDNDWKLEFPNRKDWAIFKDLYKECADRNVPTPVVKSIPIPGVNEVLRTGDRHTSIFCRPDSYISVKDDELQRAMTGKTSSYDMDSEDELWLKKFNSESFAENEIHVLEDNFELIVDAFEKAVYLNQHDLSEEKPPANLDLRLGSRNVIEAVYSYWMKKRKQKQSSLLRVFQSHPAKRFPLVPKPSFRKKRSFKRQPSQVGRGKQHCFLQGIKAGRDAVEEQNAKLKVEEAKASAKRSVESALRKRRRAQLLMNNADLATFKASVALRIAEGAALSVPPAVVADHFLD